MADFKNYSAKTVEDAITQASVALGVTSDKLEYEVLEKGSSGLLGIFGVKPAVIKARKKVTVLDEGREFLEKVFDKIHQAQAEGLEVTYDAEEKSVSINLIGGDMGVLIGKRGQTLDSLQHLVSLVINKHSEDYLRVKLDTENYRERRKETLENLAKNIAYKVKRTRRPVSLEPMNPYERRIIHATLQDDRYVVTKSEGEEPFRHVIVLLKKERKYYDKKKGQ